MDLDSLLEKSKITTRATLPAPEPIRGFDAYNNINQTSFGGMGNSTYLVSSISGENKIDASSLSNQEFLSVLGSSLAGGALTTGTNIVSNVAGDIASQIIGNVIDSSLTTISGVVTDLGGKVVNNLVAPVVDPLINMANKVTDTIQTIEEQAMEIYNKVESTVQEAYNQGMGYYNQAVNIYNNTLGVISIISPEAAQLIDSKARSEINGMVSNLASSMGFEIAGLSGIGSMLGSFSTGYSKHYDVNTIKQRIGLKINGLTIDNTYVVTYEEIYDYRGTYFPVRIFGLSLPVSLFEQIVGTNTNTDVAVDIAYGFQTRDGQDVGGTSSNDISRFNVYKNLNSYIGKLSYPRAKETEKEIKYDTDNVGTVSKYVALAVLPNEVMRKNTSKKLTNGYYKDANLTTLIVEGFYKYFGETSTEFALAPLHNDTTITKYLKTMTFPDLLKYLQKQYNIYNGGPNVFVDDRVYVINKNGPVELETPETWSYEIVIKEDSLPKMNEIYETNDASKRARIVLNKENFQQITYNVNKKINQNIYNQGGMGSLSGTDGIAAIETITAVNHNKATLPQLEDEYEIHSLLLKNFPCVFNIGDKVTLKTGKLLFEGTVFKWTAKFVNRERSIGLMIITKKKDFATGDYLGGSFSFLDSNAILSSYKDRANSAIGNLVSPYQETISSYQEKMSATRSVVSGIFGSTNIFGGN